MLLAQKYLPDLSEYKDRFMRTPLGLLTQGNVSGAVDELGAAAQGRVQAMMNPESALQAGFDFMGGGLLGVVKNPATQAAAKTHFGTTLNPKETGYILDDGTRLDFSGRHYAAGYKKEGDRFVPETRFNVDYLSNQRNVDHREIGEIVKSGEGDWGNIQKFLDESGAVRYDPYGVSLTNTNKPSKKQIEIIVNDFKKSERPLIIDIDHKTGFNAASEEFNNPTINTVWDWINSQYK